MLFSIIAGNDIRMMAIQLLLTIPIILISLSVHESAHGYIAYKMGDMTAYNLGRVTLNPLKHLDPIGAICMLVFGYGWAKPVPINSRNFKNPKKGMAFTAIAGPISNFLLGIFGALAYSLIVFFCFIHSNRLPSSETTVEIINIFATFFYLWSYMNFVLAIFNLIPIPPFDGSRFFSLFLPQKWYFAIMRYERYILPIVLIVSVVLSNILSFSPLGVAANGLFNFTATGILRLLSLIFA